MKERIVNEKVKIDYKNTKEFFDNRGKCGKILGNKYNYVLFQDDNPQLAMERDKREKKKIIPYLFDLENMSKEPYAETALDIGCGIGRWGEEILSHGKYYVGLDYSENLLEIAEKNLSRIDSHYMLIHGAVQQVLERLEQNKRKQSFDIILINGVLMYLNDEDLKQLLEAVCSLIGENTILYIKETVSKEQRLTLNQFYSKELTQNYSAIYRYVGEYTKLAEQFFVENRQMKMIACGELFDEEFKNRKETVDYFYILKK